MSREDAQNEHSEMLRAYPVRFSSAHICLPEGPLYTLLRPILLFGMFDSDMRVRTKFHTDVGIDTQYSLMSVGVPVSEIPITSNKTSKLKNHYQWIKNRKTFDQARINGIDTSHWIEHPQNHDILFRQGGHHLRQGNIDFLHSLEPHLEAYFLVSAEEKTKIRDKVIQGAMAKGCNFLEWDTKIGMWVEIHDEETIHKKVSCAFYDHRRRVEHRQERQTSKCDTDFFLGGSKRRKLEGEAFSMCSFKW